MRLWREAVAVGAGSAVVLALTTAGAPGAAAGAMALRIVALAGGDAPNGTLPVAALGLVLRHCFGMGVAAPVVTWVMFGASAGVLWFTLRGQGAPRLATLGAWLSGLGASAAISSACVGLPDLSVVGFVAAGMVAFLRRRTVAGVLWTLWIASFDAHTAAIMALVSVVLGGGAWALVAMVVAAGVPASALGQSGASASMAGLVTVGLSAATLLRSERKEPRLLMAIVLAALCMAGPTVAVGGAAVGLPGAAIAIFGEATGWQGAAVVLGAVAALAVCGAPSRLALGVGSIVFAVGIAAAGKPPPGHSLDVPLAVNSLAERTGAVLDLPFEVEGEACTASSGTNASWAYFGALHGRPTEVGIAPVPRVAAFLSEPAVLAAIDITCGAHYLVPPGLPGVALSSLGITEVVVHRALYNPAVLAVLDPIFSRQYGPPRRDHAGSVDLYHVAPHVKGVPVVGGLHLAGDPSAASWQSLEAFLQGTLPPSTRAEHPGPR